MSTITEALEAGKRLYYIGFAECGSMENEERLDMLHRQAIDARAQIDAALVLAERQAAVVDAAQRYRAAIGALNIADGYDEKLCADHDAAYDALFAAVAAMEEGYG